MRERGSEIKKERERERERKRKREETETEEVRERKRREREEVSERESHMHFCTGNWHRLPFSPAFALVKLVTPSTTRFDT
jgi:hypothetical protein